MPEKKFARATKSREEVSYIEILDKCYNLQGIN